MQNRLEAGWGGCRDRLVSAFQRSFAYQPLRFNQRGIALSHHRLTAGAGFAPDFPITEVSPIAQGRLRRCARHGPASD